MTAEDKEEQEAKLMVEEAIRKTETEIGKPILLT